jgi:Bifunctional DNA primase/polymerase, N-terminal/Primase C terminal 1 (PriCT-1)
MSIDELKRSWFPGNNLGIRVGKWSVLEPGYGLVVLDIDLRDPAQSTECYMAVERLLGHSTLNVASGRGLGGHVYLKCPLERLPEKAARTVGSGEGWKLELFSTGKQVVAPPSVHPDTKKPYQWVNVEIGTVPESLLNAPEVVASSYSVPKPATQISSSADSWGEGQRYNQLLSYAGRLQAEGWRDDQILARVEDMNLYMCNPPLEEWEVEKIAQSVLRYRKGFNTKKV